MRKVMKPTRWSTRKFAWATLNDIKQELSEIEVEGFDGGLSKESQVKIKDLKETIGYLTEICKTL